jgi:y4mF family transcriptional regulator
VISRLAEAGEAFQTRKFPIGKFRLQSRAFRRNFPVRDILIDNRIKPMLFSRSGKFMAKRMLTPADIGALVRIARKAQGLRQDQLAGASGVGLRFIVDLEAGKPTVQMGKTLLVLQTLGCSIAIAPPPEPKT